MSMGIALLIGVVGLAGLYVWFHYDPKAAGKQEKASEGDDDTEKRIW